MNKHLAIKSVCALAMLATLLVPSPAEARRLPPRLTRQVLAEAQAQCPSAACVVWVMDTQSVESCHRNVRHRNTDGSVDHGTAQVNSDNPPPWHHGDPYSVHVAVRTMVGGWKRGAAAMSRWAASGRRSASCTWRHLA